MTFRGTFALAALAASLAVPAARAEDAAGATAPVDALDSALQAIDAGGSGFAARASRLAPAVDGAFDLETLLRNSVGLGWSAIPAAQQQRLVAVFRQFTLASYVSNFAGTDDRFAVVPPPRQLGANVVVQSSITPPGGSPTRIDYVMHQTPAGWRATDVLVDGTISRVAIQRSDFRSVLADGGPDALIASLGRKVTSLSDGHMQP